MAHAGDDTPFKTPPDFDPDGADGTLDIPTTPPGERGGEDSPDALRIVELEAQVKEYKDQMLRALAEAENVRRRAQREIEDAGKFAVTKFARELLSVADNLSRALASLPGDREAMAEPVKNLVLGIEATERDLLAIFERAGIKRIEAMGQPFNPELHQAIMEVPSADHPPGTVALEMMPGYTLKERLLRASMVGVAKRDDGQDADGG